MTRHRTPYPRGTRVLVPDLVTGEREAGTVTRVLGVSASSTVAEVRFDGEECSLAKILAHDDPEMRACVEVVQ